MKNKIAIISSVLMILATQVAFSFQSDQLEKERQAVIVKYIDSLGHADIEGMKAIFNDNSIVVSTSAGKKPAIEFFSDFFPVINTVHTDLHQRFVSLTDQNRYAARFHLDYTLINGDNGQGEYVDEFVFYDNSATLEQVYMFENLKF